MNLIQILETAARKYGDKTAILMGERRVSYNELEELSNRVANALAKLGVEKGDRVATMQSSNPEFVTVFFGILKVGGIAVPLDSRYVADELESLFQDCQPKVLVADNPPLASLVSALPRFDSIKHVITIDPELDGRFISYNQIIYDNPDEAIGVRVEPDDPATISYTGGPTQDPHGVVLSHQSISTEALTSGDVLNQTEKDVLIGFALPMYHQFGLVSVLLGSIAKGSTLVVVPGTGRSIHSFMEAVEKEKGTYIWAFPISTPL